MSTKRKIEHGGNLSLRIDTRELKKSKNYFDLPSNLGIFDSRIENMWLTYQPAQYYPIVIIDSTNGQPIVRNDISVQMSISIFSKSQPPPETAVTETKNQKGVYWFKAIKPHIKGDLTMQFAAINSSEIVPLTHVCVVTAGDGNNEDEINIPIDSLTRVKNSATKQPVEKSTLPNTTDKQVIGFTLHHPYEVSRLRTPIPDDLPVLPYPHNHVVHAMHDTIERPGSSCTVSGPSLSVTFPSSLINALRDDKARVCAFRLAGQQLPDIFYDQPSANEFLGRLQNSILYTEEKSSFEAKLDSLKKQKKPFISSFGTIYLLRLTILIATSVDCVGADDFHRQCRSSSSSSPSSSSSSQVVTSSGSSRSGGSSSSSDSVPASSSSAQSSLARRSAINSKLFNASVPKLQEVVDAVVAEMAQAAHFLF